MEVGSTKKNKKRSKVEGIIRGKRNGGPKMMCRGWFGDGKPGELPEVSLEDWRGDGNNQQREV